MKKIRHWELQVKLTDVRLFNCLKGSIPSYWREWIGSWKVVNWIRWARNVARRLLHVKDSRHIWPESLWHCGDLTAGRQCWEQHSFVSPCTAASAPSVQASAVCSWEALCGSSGMDEATASPPMVQLQMKLHSTEQCVILHGMYADDQLTFSTERLILCILQM